jgi:O-antigen/teichoic acid export membrane protein
MAATTEINATPTASSERAIRGGAIRVLGYASGMLVSLGTAAVLLHHVGVAGFGRYVTVTSLVAIVGGATEAGVAVQGIRELVAREEREHRQVLGNLLAMRLTLATVGVGCALCFGLAVGYRDVLLLGTAVAGVGLLSQVGFDVFSIHLQVKLLLGRLTLIEIVRRVLMLVLFVGLALAGAGLIPFLVAASLASTAALVLIAGLVSSSMTVRPQFDQKVWRELFTDTAPYAIALSIASIYLYVTVIVMSLIATATQTGVFATSFRVAQSILTVPSLLLIAVFPLMAERRKSEDDFADTGKIFAVALVFGAWLSLATALGSSVIIGLIAPPSGHAAVPVLRIQALVFVLSFVSTSSALGLVALRRYRPVLISSASALVLNVALAAILVPSSGARGGAIADVAAELLPAIGLTVALARSAPKHEIKLSLLPVVGVACAGSLLVLLVPIGAVAQVVGATIIFFSALLVTHAIPTEVTSAARNLRVVQRLMRTHSDG